LSSPHLFPLQKKKAPLLILIMVKERSAINKSSSKKRVSGTHVSGLSTSKSTGKRKESGLKYGQLSRKQKQDLEDYGELVPKDFEEEAEESLPK
jgi:U3 small nucleolar RNA-associated protein 25